MTPPFPFCSPSPLRGGGRGEGFFELCRPSRLYRSPWRPKETETMLRPRHAEDRRRAVILMVVLALLTLFAIVGITFVFYAQKNHSASVNFREGLQRATIPSAPDIPGDYLLNYSLAQLIFDTDDSPNGVQSGMRGHSFARTMWG